MWKNPTIQIERQKETDERKKTFRTSDLSQQLILAGAAIVYFCVRMKSGKRTEKVTTQTLTIATATTDRN